LIEALVGATKRIVKNPLLLLPSLATIAIMLGLAYLLAPFAIDLLLNVVFLEIVPDAGLAQMPFQFVALYGTQLLAMLALAVLGGILFAALSYWYAVYIKAGSKQKGAFGEACNETLKALGKIAAFVVFVFLIMALFAIVFWVIALVSLTIQLLGIILAILLALVGFYIYVKLAFAVQALGLEEGTVKQGLEQSWQFAVSRFWQILVFLIILSAVNQAIVAIGSYASDLVLDEVLSIVVLAIFWAISLSFAGIAMPLYYSKKKLGKKI